MRRFDRSLKAPIAPTREHVDERHGEAIPDPYHWLRDREDPETLAYLEAENAYADAVMAPTGPLQQALYDEFLSRIQESDESVPVRRGPWLYYSRTEEGKQYSIHCRRPASGTERDFDFPAADEQVILDGNELAEGQPYFALGAAEESHDHRLLAYAVDLKGDEKYTLRVRNLEDGSELPDTAEGLATSLEWSPDGRYLFYTTLDEAHRPYRLYRHQLGRPTDEDVLVYEEGDERFFLVAYTSKDRRWLIVASQSNTTSEARLLSLDRPTGTPRLVEPRRESIEYEIDVQDERLLVLTNDDAVNFRLCEAPVDDPGRANWRDVVAHEPRVKLEGVEVFRRHLVLTERVDGVLGLRVIGERTHRIEFDEPVRTVFSSGDSEYDAGSVRFVYSSPVSPRTVYDYDLSSRERVLRKRQPVLGGYDPSRYRCERIEATAADGTRVPISLLYRADREPRPGPLLLYAYGAYGISSDPSFDSTRFSLIDRGFVFAIAHVRGGGDLGRPWYDSGKLEHKANTFTDFVACAETLIEKGWTTTERLAIRGGSAGGLLIGAVVNLRPDLFEAAIAKVPFVDVVNTMSDPTLPLTVTEWEEWGDPREPGAYRTMRAYSPYDNVGAHDYPHLLIMGGLNDPRVAYWEPAKWAARLRATKVGERLVLLRTEMGAGHGGPSGRYDYLRELALEYAFLIVTLDAPAESIAPDRS